MKKSNLLIIPLICLAAFLGVMLSNTEMTEAANNETCSPETFRDDYIANIDDLLCHFRFLFRQKLLKKRFPKLITHKVTFMVIQVNGFF